MNLYIPDKGLEEVTPQNIQDWYNNISIEIENTSYSNQVRESMRDSQNYYGKLLNKKTSNFYMHHFSESLHQTINYSLKNKPKEGNTKWLEVGAGAGNQAILMALFGFEIFAVDIDQAACNIIRERKKYYETSTGRALLIHIITTDILTYKRPMITYDVINFQFSFNNISPSRVLLEYLLPKLNVGGLWIMHEGNNSSIYNRIFRPHKSWMSPVEVYRDLIDMRLEVLRFRGGYVLPPVLFKYSSLKIIFGIDKLLTRFILLSNSYHLIGQKK